jgi:hypothetical protein
MADPISLSCLIPNDCQGDREAVNCQRDREAVNYDLDFSRW